MQATDVRIKTDTKTLPGTIITTAATPQSYYGDTPNGEQLQRNRAHLNVRKPNRVCQKDSSIPTQMAQQKPQPVTSQPTPSVVVFLTKTITKIHFSLTLELPRGV